MPVINPKKIFYIRDPNIFSVGDVFIRGDKKYLVLQANIFFVSGPNTLPVWNKYKIKRIV